MRVRPTNSCAARYYSNHGGKLLQSNPVITPVNLENDWEFMYDKNTSKYQLHMRQVITPSRFEITPIYVEIDWNLLDGSKSRKLFQSTPYLKYITIQLRLRQKGNSSSPSRCSYVGIYWGRGGMCRFGIVMGCEVSTVRSGTDAREI